MKSRWEALGFDSEVFELFVRMRGGKTRVKLLNSLLIPKDRFQLAQELGLDWKAVDRHVMMLNKFGFVHEQTAYGRVRIYELTSVGKMLLAAIPEPQRRGERRERRQCSRVSSFRGLGKRRLDLSETQIGFNWASRGDAEIQSKKKALMPRTAASEPSRRYKFTENPPLVSARTAIAMESAIPA